MPSSADRYGGAASIQIAHPCGDEEKVRGTVQHVDSFGVTFARDSDDLLVFIPMHRVVQIEYQDKK